MDAVGITVSAIVVAYSVLAPPPPGIASEVQVILGVFFATILLWVTKPVPYTISSLLCVILLYTLGPVETFGEAASGFASTLVFFFILLILIGKSIVKVDIDGWIANRLVHGTSTPSGSMRRLAATILVMTLVIPSGLARAATTMPIIDQTNDLYEQADDSSFRRLSYYLVGHLNSVGSMALMTSGGMAIVTAEIINTRVQPFTWVEWGLYMVPPVVLIFLGTAITASQFYDVTDTTQTSPADTTQTSPADTTQATPSDSESTPRSNANDTVEREPLTRDQRIVIGALTATILFWIIGSFLNVPAIVPATAMVLVLSLPWVGVITVEEIHDVNWGIIFLIGAMLSIADVMEAYGATQLLIDFLLAFVVTGEGLFTIYFLLAFAVIVRLVFSGTAPVIVIVLPIFLEFTEPLAIDPLFLSLSLVMVLGCTVFLPFNYAPALLAYEEGPLSMSEFFALGGVTVFFGFLTMTLSWLVYWPALELFIEGVF